MARRRFDINLITGYITRLIDQVSMDSNLTLPPIPGRRLALNLRSQWYHARTSYIHELRDRPERMAETTFSERYTALTSNILKITPNPLKKDADPDAEYTFSWASEEKTVLAGFIYKALGERPKGVGELIYDPSPEEDRDSLTDLLNR